jgi:hypothetical protein
VLVTKVIGFIVDATEVKPKTLKEKKRESLSIFPKQSTKKVKS